MAVSWPRPVRRQHTLRRCGEGRGTRPVRVRVHDGAHAGCGFVMRCHIRQPLGITKRTSGCVFIARPSLAQVINQGLVVIADREHVFQLGRRVR